MSYKFEKAYNEYGASMGRASYGDIKTAERVKLFKVILDRGGYDNGGAYWGTGKPLFCAEADSFRDFIRAGNRKEASEIMGLKNNQLLKKV